MKQKILLLIAAVTFILINSCAESITGPEPESGRRDYVWTEDTISIPFGYLWKMWGSSQNDVWCIGPGGSLDQTIWHFNGVDWDTDGKSRPISPYAIFGFNKNDIWIGGQNSLIWWYNGNKWEEKFRPLPLEHWSYSTIYSIFGTSANNLFAVGYIDSTNVPQKEIGTIFSYDGSKWKRLDIETQRLHFAKIRKASNDPNYYLVGYIINEDWSNAVKLFSFDGTRLKEIYYGVVNDYKGAVLELINNKIYFGIDNGVYTYDGNKFNLKFNVDNQKFTQGLAGRNEKDIFLFMWDGIAHYNGQDIQYIIQDNNLNYSDMLVFNDEIFVLCNHKSKDVAIIKRGRLKQTN